MSINIDNIKVRKAVFANKEGTIVNMEVLFEGWEEYLPFSANPLDPAQHGRDIYKRAIAGEYGDISEYVERKEQAPRVLISFQEFRNKFTKDELIKIRASTLEIPELYVAWEDLQFEGEFYLDDDIVSDNLNKFFTHKVLTKKRINEVLKTS